MLFQVALAFPTMMSAPLWILNLRLGDEFALGAVYRAPWFLLSYASLPCSWDYRPYLWAA